MSADLDKANAEGSLDSFVRGLYSHKLVPGAFCIVALGMHILLVCVQGCADLFGADKEGCELNGNRSSKVLLPGSVLTKCTNRLP